MIILSVRDQYKAKLKRQMANENTQRRVLARAAQRVSTPSKQARAYWNPSAGLSLAVYSTGTHDEPRGGGGFGGMLSRNYITG